MNAGALFYISFVISVHFVQVSSCLLMLFNKLCPFFFDIVVLEKNEGSLNEPGCDVSISNSGHLPELVDPEGLL